MNKDFDSAACLSPNFEGSALHVSISRSYKSGNQKRMIGKEIDGSDASETSISHRNYFPFLPYTNHPRRRTALSSLQQKKEHRNGYTLQSLKGKVLHLHLCSNNLSLIVKIAEFAEHIKVNYYNQQKVYRRF